MIRYRPIHILPLLLACLLPASIAQAHQQPMTLMLLDVGNNQVGMELHVPLGELELAFGHSVSENPEMTVATWAPAFRKYLMRHIRPVSHNPERPWTVQVEDHLQIRRTEQKQTGGPFQEILVTLTLSPPPNAGPRDFTLHYDAILHQVVTHKLIASIRSDWRNGRTGQQTPEQIGLIQVNPETARIDPLEIHLDHGSKWTGFLSMIRLGIQHIQEGTDHILFVLALLLPAPLRVNPANSHQWGSFGGTSYALQRLLKIVTAFTAGHSLTLLAGALGWVRLPQQPVEVLIAVSILVSALHAIRPVFPFREIYVAAGFGLVHGLAFASGLLDLHLNPQALLLSILGFNLGIEAMQLFVIALTAPWFLLISQTPAGPCVRIVSASLAAVAAAVWACNRMTGMPDAIEKAAAGTHPGPLGILLLALIAIPAYLYGGRPSEAE